LYGADLRRCLAILSGVIAIGATGCLRARLPADVGVAIADTCPDIDESILFPENVLPYADFEESDLLRRRLMSRFLARMEEPSLWCGSDEADEEYRLVLDETWTDPRAIRVSRIGDDFVLNVVVLEGPGGFTRGPIKERYSRRLTASEWRQLTAAIDELDFWRMTTSVDNLLGNDGTVWTIEARRDGRYHYVGRWQGADGVEDAGRAFVSLANRRPRSAE
jgi:hypothetical protein